MAFTYSGNPGASPADAVRFMTGDTLEQGALLQDGEIAYLLTQAGGNSVSAAIAAIEAMMVRCAHMVDETVGAVSISYSQRLGNLQTIKVMLQTRQGKGGAALPRAGGISYGDKAKSQCNPDAVQPRFTKANTRDPNPELPGRSRNPLLGSRWR